jgi:hypothetical protein
MNRRGHQVLSSVRSRLPSSNRKLAFLALEVHDLQVKNKELREQLEQSKLEAKKYQDES